MILLECTETGEQCLVESADGYAGWRVVDEDVPPPPGEFYRWVEHDRRWRMDPEQRLKAENVAAVRDHETLVEIINGLLAEIEALKERLS